MYWSCLLSQQSETGHAIAHKGLEGPDNLTWIRHPQGFLQARRNQDISGLHGQWLELVKAYIKRDVFRTSDRFRAIAGLAVQYLSPYTDENGDVKGQEYLAGLWRQTFPEDLSWSVQAPKAPERKLRSVAPAWSWASIPVCSDIATQNMVESTSDFKLLETLRLGKEGQSDKPQKVVMRGALIRSIKVCGRVRRLLSARSEEKEWALIMLRHGSKEEFDMSNFISDSIHSRNAKTGQFVAYEPNKHEIVAQLDYLFPEKGAWDPLDILTDSDLKTLMCLQIGRSSMLLLRPYRMKKIDEDHPLENPVWRYQRVGICNSVHNSFFLAASLETLYLV